MSQRSCERIFGVSQNTVVKLFEEAGDWAIAHLASLSDLTIARTQADELYAFVAARSFNVADMAAPSDDAGTIWTYLAVCAKTKLIYAYHLGAQGLDDATTFMRRVASKLKRKSDGRFVVRPTIITDGLGAYPEAVERAFGSDANHGVLRKSYSKTDKDGNRLSGSRYEGAQRDVVKGEIDERDIHTSYVERQNLNVRMGVRRYGRKTNAFSKKLANHERHVALWIVYHNYCWVPRPRRPRDGSQSWTKRVTAAMEAGVDDELWGIDHLIGMTDAFTQDRRMSADDETGKTGADSQSVVVDPADVELAPSYWVYRSRHHQTTKVHAAGCSNCRDGMGKKGTGGTPAGEWLAVYRL
ncbi:IS1 transposase, partial [Caulobacter sp. AP07]|uniref:IS1 family transposase n=1 Tax=Caulobacter sp. AP07 TaxID=1144304 RepID=UPI000271F249